MVTSLAIVPTAVEISTPEGTEESRHPLAVAVGLPT